MSQLIIWITRPYDPNIKIKTFTPVCITVADQDA